MTLPVTPRVDRAYAILHASPVKVFAAFADPVSYIRWLPPKGMTGRLLEYDFRTDGRYVLELTYDEATPGEPGKSTSRTDVSRGRFTVVEPGRRIVQTVEFESDDPAFAGEMLLSWTLTPFGEGTRVDIEARQVPTGIGREDHVAGFDATLANLAEFVTGRR